MFGARQLMDRRLRLSDKTVRKFAELLIYCQRRKCSTGNVVYGSISLCRYSSPGEGAPNESVVVENGDFRFFHSLSSERFTYVATRLLSRDATVDDLGEISRSLDCFTSNFSKTVRDIRQKLLGPIDH